MEKQIKRSDYIYCFGKLVLVSDVLRNRNMIDGVVVAADHKITGKTPGEVVRCETSKALTLADIHELQKEVIDQRHSLAAVKEREEKAYEEIKKLNDYVRELKNDLLTATQNSDAKQTPQYYENVWYVVRIKDLAFPLKYPALYERGTFQVWINDTTRNIYRPGQLNVLGVMSYVDNAEVSTIPMPASEDDDE